MSFDMEHSFSVEDVDDFVVLVIVGRSPARRDEPDELGDILAARGGVDDEAELAILAGGQDLLVGYPHRNFPVVGQLFNRRLGSRDRHDEEIVICKVLDLEVLAGANVKAHIGLERVRLVLEVEGSGTGDYVADLISGGGHAILRQSRSEGDDALNEIFRPGPSIDCDACRSRIVRVLHGRDVPFLYRVTGHRYPCSAK